MNWFYATILAAFVLLVFVVVDEGIRAYRASRCERQHAAKLRRYVRENRNR